MKAKSKSEPYADVVAAIEGWQAVVTSEMARLRAEIRRLERAGAVEYARVQFKDNRYALLNINPPRGERTRTYVGKDPSRIEEARQRVANGALLTRAKRALVDLQDAAERFGYALRATLKTVPSTLENLSPKRRR